MPPTAPSEALVGLVQECLHQLRSLPETPLPAGQAALARHAVRHRVDLRGLGLPIEGLVVHQRPSASPGLLLETVGAVGRVHFVPPAFAWVVQPLVADLFLAAGERLELDTTDVGDHPVLPRSTWVHPPGWGAAFAELPSAEDPARTLGQVYREDLHPAVLAALPARARRLLDLGGGDGAFAAAFLATRPGATAHVVDRDPALLAQATAVGLTTHRQDLLHEDPAPGEAPFDALVAIGLLEASVMERREALDLLRRVRPRLAPQGHLVLCGASASLVRRADLEALDLEVLGCTASLGGHLRQRYVASPAGSPPR